MVLIVIDLALQVEGERMKRIWQVQEQVVEDPTTKLRLEFSSVHTDEVNAGNEAPAADELVVLRLWTSDRNRMVTFLFERNGRFVRADIEPLDASGEPIVAGARAEPGDGGYETHHWDVGGANTE